MNGSEYRYKENNTGCDKMLKLGVWTWDLTKPSSLSLFFNMLETFDNKKN
jgi:hypothetical protein